jgi:hypothetical protein
MVTLAYKNIENPPVVGSYRLDKILEGIPGGSANPIPRNRGFTIFNGY